MTSLASVLIFFLLKSEPEVDLSIFMVSWGTGERTRASETVQEEYTVKSVLLECLLSWKRGPPPCWGVSEESEAMDLRMFPWKGPLCLGDRIQGALGCCSPTIIIPCPEV